MKKITFLLALTLTNLAFAAETPKKQMAPESRKIASNVPAFQMGFDCEISQVYVPEELLQFGDKWVDHLAPNTLGYYTLDLTSAGKGKGLESVKLTMTPDKKGLIVNQYTRGLPPTTVPLAGGTVDFDHRFAEGLTCKAFQL